jgi:protein-S-isoprenylcysteine O-methyltransferase Ste14
MALTFDQAGGDSKARGWAANLGLAYAWSGFAVMWVFWVCFVIFLTDPSKLAPYWPLPTVDRGGVVEHPVAAALIDLALIALFGLQHSLMARPWFKTWWAASIPPAFERCTYVHMANLALFALIIFWQPIPGELWNVSQEVWRDALWAAFAGGWIVLFLGARSFGVLDLLGVQQMRRWTNGQRAQASRLKTGLLYRWLRHPMYVGVLLGVWATPTMSIGHALLAVGLTGYVLIAIRYEERDLANRFGAAYITWRAPAGR